MHYGFEREDIYYSEGSDTDQYQVDRSNSNWINILGVIPNSLTGTCVITKWSRSTHILSHDNYLSQKSNIDHIKLHS